MTYFAGTIQDAAKAAMIHEHLKSVGYSFSGVIEQYQGRMYKRYERDGHPIFLANNGDVRWVCNSILSINDSLDFMPASVEDMVHNGRKETAKRLLTDAGVSV